MAVFDLAKSNSNNKLLSLLVCTWHVSQHKSTAMMLQRVKIDNINT